MLQNKLSPRYHIYDYLLIIWPFHNILHDKKRYKKDKKEVWERNYYQQKKMTTMMESQEVGYIYISYTILF